MGLALRGVVMMALYVGVAVAPLLAALLGRPLPGRGFVVDFSVALGFLGLAMMLLQFMLVARLKAVAAPFGMDALIQFHRQIAFVALVIVLTHPVLLFIDDPAKLALLDLRTAPWRARFAVSSVVLLLALVAFSVWRKQLRMRYEAWQLGHELLALAVCGLALAHMVKVDYYMRRPWQSALWVVLAGSLVGILGWVRLVRPLLAYRRPWRVAEVRPERGDACTLVLEPVGHRGFTFEPGQFAWVVVGRTPFALTHHPFSLCGSAEADGKVSFTIKSRGDFTSSVPKIAVGTRAYVDGPHGVFSADREEGPGYVLVGGGVGITPLMSIARTLADREDPRPCLLVYGSRDWDGVTFREELDELAERARLRVVHVLEKPPEGWTGERGYITAELLRRHLPKRHARQQWFICGPGPMMDAVERAVASLGVPAERIHTERFDMV